MAKERLKKNPDDPEQYYHGKPRDKTTHDIKPRDYATTFLPANGKTDGENARFLRHNLEVGSLPQIDLYSVDQVQNRIKQYFEICEKNDMKPSLAGFTCSLGMDRKNFWTFMQKPELPTALLLKKVYDLLDAQMVDYMQNGKINPVSGIFLAKNFFGYSDKTELEISAEGGAEDPNKLFDKYMGDVVTDDDIIEIKDE